MQRCSWGLGVLAACGFHHGSAQMPVDATDAPVIDDAPGDAALPAGRCDPLAVTGSTVSVATVADLRTAITSATASTTILVADGTYDLSAGTLQIPTDGIVVRGASGDASKVILDGGLAVTPVVRVGGSNVTLAYFTIARSSGSGVLISPPTTGDITGDIVYAMAFADNDGAAVRVSPNNGTLTGPFADGGTIACSHITETSGNTNVCGAGTLGIAIDASRGWTVRDNQLAGVRCDTALQRAMFFRYGVRDITVARNTIIGSNMNIGLGDGDPTNTAPARTYADAVPAACGTTTPNLWGGIACDNVVDGLDVPIFQGNGSFDTGISGWTACDTWVMHNTVVSPPGADTFTNFEYRFAGSYVHFVNNLSLLVPTQRDSGMQDATYASSNITYTATTDFVDATNGDLHLAQSAPEVAGVSIAGLGMCDRDADDKPRNLSAPMVGAYER